VHVDLRQHIHAEMMQWTAPLWRGLAVLANMTTALQAEAGTIEEGLRRGQAIRSAGATTALVAHWQL
jgi:hypothetical protein